jgi:hypothetical protein
MGNDRLKTQRGDPAVPNKLAHYRLRSLLIPADLVDRLSRRAGYSSDLYSNTISESAQLTKY